MGSSVSANKYLLPLLTTQLLSKLVFLETRFLTNKQIKQTNKQTNKLYNKAGKCILHNYQLINSTQSFYRSSASHKIPHLLWNPKVCYHVCSSPPRVPALSQLNSVIMQTTLYWGLILLNIRTAEQCSVTALGEL
jgi:hypothetical protein